MDRCPHVPGQRCPRPACAGMARPETCEELREFYRATSGRPSVDPAVRDRVLGCPHRGPEAGLVPTDEERAGCCGGGPELTACSLGKGARPGRVTLADCLACRA